MSVVVSVRNGEPFVAACLESLLAQDYPKDRHEIFVVDNGSTDGTVQALKHYDVKVLSKPAPFGCGAARNAGIQQSRGDLIAITDIDCVPDRQWLRCLAEGWEEAAYGGFVGTISILPTENPIEQWMAQFYDQAENLKHSPFAIAQTANVAYRRQVFERIGGFDENLPWWADVEFAWRMQSQTAYRYQWNPRAVIYHRNRATLGEVAQKFYGRGYGKAACAKRIPPFRTPPIPWLSARHGCRAAVQAGKVMLRSLGAAFDQNQKTALLRTQFWFSFHLGMAAGLAWGWLDSKNNHPFIPKLQEGVEIK